jgi:2-C-methyl-D-erythritol 4-phosphate cytidylyltransferase
LLSSYSAAAAASCCLQAAIPKQYLELKGQPIATYSLQTFAAMPQVQC